MDAYASVQILTSPYIEVSAILVTPQFDQTNALIARFTSRKTDHDTLAFAVWVVNEACKRHGLEAIPVPLASELWQQLLSEGVRA